MENRYSKEYLSSAGEASPDEYVARKTAYEFAQLIAELIETTTSEVRVFYEDAVAKNDGKRIETGAIESFVTKKLHEHLGPLHGACLRRTARVHNIDVERAAFELVEGVLAGAFPYEPDSVIDKTLDGLIRDGHAHTTVAELTDPKHGPDVLLKTAERVLEAFGDLASSVQEHVRANGWKGIAVEIAKDSKGGEVWCDLAMELAWRAHAYVDFDKMAGRALGYCVKAIHTRGPANAEEAVAVGTAAFKEMPGSRRLAQLYLAKFNAQGLAGVGDVAAFFGDEAAKRVRDDGVNARLARIVEVVRQCVFPPANTAQNVEVLAMSLAVFLICLQTNSWLAEDTAISKELLDPVIASFMTRFNAVGARVFERVHSDVILGANESAQTATERAAVLGGSFFGMWQASAFARLEVSHKLAAALCLTDIEDSVDIRAPWSAWSLLIPDGLFGSGGPARVWCVGKTPVVLVFPSGLLLGWDVENAGGQVQTNMLRALILGSCAVLSDPERVRRSGRWGSVAQPKHRRHGPPPEGARYILAQPVSIDLREEVHASLNGERAGGRPKVQFLVRGHFRNQAHGVGRVLRTLKWIEPFWKGPKDTRILLRAHKVKKK